MMCVTFAACSQSGTSGGGSLVPQGRAVQPSAWRGTYVPDAHLRGKSATPIQHIVILIQENRSFDNLFNGYPGANTVTTGYTANGTQVTLQPLTLASAFDIYHQFNNAINDMNAGKMNGFDSEKAIGCKVSCTLPAYSYVPQSQTTTYFNIASQYVVADNFFPSDEDGSFVSHQYLIAAQANGAYGLPGSHGTWGCDSDGEEHILSPKTIPGTPTKKKMPACFDPYTTLGDEIDAAPPLTWHFYSAPRKNLGYIWSAYDVVKHIREGSDWTTDVTADDEQFFTDVAAGNLANVTWITPTFANSDHPGSRSLKGPAWVAKVVDAVGNSQFWNTTAVFVLWDDWGGWYDHVPPPVLDFDGLGVRVPLLVVSPYTPQGMVAHTQYEFGSVLGFVEQNFGLAPLSASDARANPLAGGDVFNFSQPARTFTPF
jgi:phospholipase C